MHKKLELSFNLRLQEACIAQLVIVILNNPPRTNHKIQLEEDLFLSVKDCFIFKRNPNFEKDHTMITHVLFGFDHMGNF